MKEIIATTEGAQPVGPYTHVVLSPGGVGGDRRYNFGVAAAESVGWYDKAPAWRRERFISIYRERFYE
jgi:hypothetical protein